MYGPGPFRDTVNIGPSGHFLIFFGVSSSFPRTFSCNYDWRLQTPAKEVPRRLLCEPREYGWTDLGLDSHPFLSEFAWGLGSRHRKAHDGEKRLLLRFRACLCFFLYFCRIVECVLYYLLRFAIHVLQMYMFS